MSISMQTQIDFVNYPQVGKDAAVSAPLARQLVVFSARVLNRSGSPANIGVVRKFAITSERLYRYTAVGTSYTELTLPLSGATNIVSTTNGDGFAVQTKRKSGLIGFEVSQAGAAGVYVYEYWNGSSWATLNTIATPDLTATGTKILLFMPPLDWAAGGTSLNSDMYSIRVRATTAPGTAIQATSAWSGQLLEFVESVADNSSLLIEFEANRPLLLESGEGIMPYYSGASNDNGIVVSHSNV